MSTYIKIFFALDLLLVALEHLAPAATRKILPLGGSGFTQLAGLLLLGIAAHELFANNRTS